MNRSVSDIIAITFAIIVGLILLSLTATVIYEVITHPESPVIGQLLSRMFAAVGTSLGALVGYLAGRNLTKDDED